MFVTVLLQVDNKQSDLLRSGTAGNKFFISSCENQFVKAVIVGFDWTAPRSHQWRPRCLAATHFDDRAEASQSAGTSVDNLPPPTPVIKKEINTAPRWRNVWRKLIGGARPL